MALAEVFAEVARDLLAEDTVEDTLRTICSLAVETVEGCEHAGVWLLRGAVFETPASTGDVPRVVGLVQSETGEGPCVDALRDHAAVHVDDLATDDRWPAFTPRAVDRTGVRSILSCRLFVESDTIGALSLYSTRPGAFDEEAVRYGVVFAAHAAMALSGAQRLEGQEIAIRSRDVIGQAKGILMARQGVSEDRAFDMLRRASQRLNVKLRDVAERVASDTAGGASDHRDHGVAAGG
jgi:putative methionine-R-sulfoxide reductase with GAF domain